jgi:hypothetical protein
MADRAPDPEAFRALYRTHYRTVCRYLALRADSRHVEDLAAETFLVAWRRQAQLPEPDLFKGPQGVDAPVPFAALDVIDLARLLERARRGDEKVWLVGEKTIRGIPTHKLRIDFTSSSVRNGTTNAPLQWSRLIYVDKEHFLPVQVVELVPGSTMTTDFFEMERIPRTAESERLLQMSPHPGAKREIEGRV